MPHLGMEFLGGFRVTLDGAVVASFESNKVRALLAYLATESQRPHPRDSLAALFWPDWPDSAALSNLRYALSDLRKVIGDRAAEPPYLLISRETIQFNTASEYLLDVNELVSNISGAETTVEGLEHALQFYKGEFLEGFSLREAAPFDDWRRLKGEQLHRANREILHRLAAALERSREYERALPYARRQVEIEAWDESAQRQLMRLLALSGRRSEALAQYEACCKSLDKELGISPTAETTRLVEQIREGEYEADASAPRSRLTEASPTIRLPASLEALQDRKRPVFVAREQELKQLYQHLESALSGNGQMAFITGEAGRGKTALLREFARQAYSAYPDLLVAAGNCNPYSGVSDPYLPLRSVLRTLLGNIELAGSTGMIDQAQAIALMHAMPQALSTLVSYGSYLIDSFIPGDELLLQAEAAGIAQPELRRFVEQAANKPASMAQQHLFEQYCAVLRTFSRHHPLLILLDDLQWVDGASAGLLYHLGTRLEGRRILVLGAYRPEEVLRGRDGERHPLEKALAECKRLYGEAGVDLAQSDEAKGRGFIAAFLDSEPNRLGGPFREKLYMNTAGHALFTVELLRAMQERGDLVRDGEGLWIEGVALDWKSLPARVEAVIAERIGRLEGVLRETLSIASVEGEEFTAQVTARVKAVSERQLLQELSQELEGRHRLVREQGEVQIAGSTLSRYRFAHALYQQYMYNLLGTAERRLLHRATAEALEELHAGSLAAIAPQLAYHWSEARDVDKTREYMLLAGQVALAAYANQDAERYFRQALELNPADEQQAALLAGLGEALRLQGQREEAVIVLRQGIDLYRQLDDLDGMANLYRCLAAVLHQDNFQEAWTACQEGLQQLESAPESPGLARFLAEAGRTSFFAKDGVGEDINLRALIMAQRLGVLDAQAEATINKAYWLEWHGQIDDSIQVLEQVIPFCETHGLWSSAARAHNNLGTTLFVHAHDLHAGYTHCLQAAQLNRQIGFYDSMFFTLDSALYALMIDGQLSSVEAVASEFLELCTAPQEQISQFLDGISGELHYWRGEWLQALEYHRTRLKGTGDRPTVAENLDHNFRLASALTEMHVFTGAGDLMNAEEVLLENLEIVSNPIIYKSLLAKVYSLQGRITEAHVLLAELLRGPRKHFLEAKSVHAMAERRWDQAASITQSLIALLQSSGFRWEWARALIDLGDIYAQRDHPGDQERAREAYQRSLEMFSEMEAGGYVRVLNERLKGGEKVRPEQ